jgi:predicted secreted protein
MTLSRRIAVAVLALLLSLALASPALAQKPGAHIVGDLTIDKSLTTGLTVSGRGPGLATL